MVQNKGGAVLGVIASVIGLGIAGAFHGDKSSTAPVSSVSSNNNPQPYVNSQPYANPDYGYGGVRPSDPYQDAADAQLQRLEEERIEAQYEAKVQQIEAEQEAWDQYVREHPAGSVGNPYDQP